MRGFLATVVFLSFFVLLSFATDGQPVMAEEVPPAVQEAAEEGLPVLLGVIQEKVLHQFNFSSPEELSQATLGTPFQVFTIYPETLLGYDGTKPIQEIISATDYWFFPVIVKGQVRTLLTVTKMGEQWEAAGIGSSGLGNEWVSKVAQYDSSAGYTHKLVRIYQAKADLLFLGGAEGDKLVPLESARVALESEGDFAPGEPADIIFKLQECVKQAIEGSK